MLAGNMARSCSIFKTVCRRSPYMEAGFLHTVVHCMKPSIQPVAMYGEKQLCVPSYRNLHSTNTLLRKVKEEFYMKYRVFNTEGQYLLTTELLNVNKFCHRYKRYTYTQMESVPTTDKETELEAVQLIDKKQDAEISEKRIKLIKFKKDVDGHQKILKILEILVDHGKVMIDFGRRGTQAEPEVRQVVSQYATIQESMPGTSVLATLRTVDNQMLLGLFKMIENEHASHIASVQDMLKVVNKDNV